MKSHGQGDRDPAYTRRASRVESMQALRHE